MESSDRAKINKQVRMASTDIISSLIVMTVAAVVSIWAINMPRPTGWSSAPGLVPLLFAGTMFLMGLGLFVTALNRKGFSSLRTRLSTLTGKNLTQDIQTQRSLWIIMLISVYLLILSGWLPFEIAGFLFLMSTFAVFWKEGRWLKIIITSVSIPLLFSLTFRFLFSILLPGDSIFDYFF